MTILSKLLSPFRSDKGRDTGEHSPKWEPAHSLRVSSYSPGRYEATENLSGYKAVTDGIAKVVVPRGTRFVSPNGSSEKVRAEKLRVRWVRKIPGRDSAERLALSGSKRALGHEIVESESIIARVNPVTYRAGETVKPDAFSDNLKETCDSGLHLFPSIEDALQFYAVYN